MPQCGSGPAKCDWKWSCARVLQNTRQHNPKLTCKTWPKLAPLTGPIFGHSGAPNQPFFRKKMHNFSKTTYSFGHIHVQNQALRWDQKMNLKPGPNSGTPLRKYIEIQQMWLKMVPLTGSRFDPKGELNSDTQAPVTFLKNTFFKNQKNHSKDCNIWNFIAAVVGTDTGARHWALIPPHRHPWGSHFLARQQNWKLTPFWVNFLIILLPGTVRDKKLLEFWTRRKEPKTDPLSNPVQHMSSQPLTDIQSQAASTTMNLIQKIYIPVLLNLLN